MDPGAIGRVIGSIVGALTMGAVLGLIPFFIGRKKGAYGLATAALICCMAANIFYAGFIMAIIFTIIILVRG